MPRNGRAGIFARSAIRIDNVFTGRCTAAAFGPDHPKRSKGWNPVEFTVLLIDDEEDFLTPLTKRLKKRDLTVLNATSGEAALTLLAKESVDVAVLDVKMPGMDGIETLRAIRKSHPSVEVILLTGHANIEAAVEGMNLGAFDYLMKPMNIDELVYKLQDAYQHRRIQLEKSQKSSTEGSG